jgi:hypothetical protein
MIPGKIADRTRKKREQRKRAPARVCPRQTVGEDDSDLQSHRQQGQNCREPPVEEDGKHQRQPKGGAQKECGEAEQHALARIERPDFEPDRRRLSKRVGGKRRKDHQKEQEQKRVGAARRLVDDERAPDHERHEQKEVIQAE